MEYAIQICNYISFDRFIVPLSVTLVAQSLDMFSIETTMFSGTLAKSSAVNSQECDTELNVSAQSNQTVIKFRLCFLLLLKLLYL